VCADAQKPASIHLQTGSVDQTFPARDLLNHIFGKVYSGPRCSGEISPQIAHAIAMPASVDYKGHPEVQQTDLLFPGCMQVSARAELPIRGQKLRHSYRAVCADLGVDALISHFLLGHAPKGISQEYIPTLILQNGPGMRAAQWQISKRMFDLLGLRLGENHDAPLVSDAPDGPTRKKR
jgi:hypothetical protein